MISRRQIIRAGQAPDPNDTSHLSQQAAASSSGASSSSSSRPLASAGASKPRAQATRQQVAAGQHNTKTMAQSKRQTSSKTTSDSNQQDSSDGYVAASSANQYDDYVLDERNWRPPQATSRRAANEEASQRQVASEQPAYRHFDPYSIYSEEEDVWYSEERLFEDHLDEIYNKWPLLDDDIWCKLIIMERNRRIGKAYARVPIVTIDGSHELSYDGYKLALNGFDNPDRDTETEECRKRIGKGIRIKMDNFGNILIKRFSKSGVYIKEWINPALASDGSPSNSTNGGAGRVMPSRQQLIKMAASGAAGGGQRNQISSLANSTGTPTSSSSGGSSMESPNDSAVCDEVLSVGGRLELEKIYVMFDMKKFQANITQELCRPYPDRRKLEQQCFSIVGLSRDSEEVLNLACWVMVINIVALEMLNERFPIMPNHHHNGGYPSETMMSEMGVRRSQTSAPSFVSIFDHHNNHHERLNNDLASKEEDPYTLPANASSSDVKSSINDYGTTSTKNISSLMDNPAAGNGRHHQLPSRYYGASKAYSRRAGVDLTSSSSARQADIMRHRSKSNYDIYGPTSKPVASSSRHERYNNSSSIYSPGHMLVPPSGDPVPPKLPPRDFNVKRTKSKSSSNVDNINNQFDNANMMMMMNDNSENIYSVGNQQQAASGSIVTDSNSNKAVVSRKGKKNRFLESLKAPLELAKSSSNRSASVVGAPFSGSTNQPSFEHPMQPTTTTDNSNSEKTNKKLAAKSKSGGFSKAKNLKSFLGVGSSKSSSKDNNYTDEANYVHVDGDKSKRSSKSKLSRASNEEVDSVVDPNEDLGADESGQQVVAGLNSSTSSSAASYNDLDIPTPDYETDENIYALDESAAVDGFDNLLQQQQQHRSRRYSSSQQKDSRNMLIQASKSTPSGRQSSSATNHNKKNNKDDLYYSGFRAHIPKNSTSATSTSMAADPTSMASDRAQSGKLTSSATSSSSSAMLNNNHHHHINDNNNNDKMSCHAGSARDQVNSSSASAGRYLSQTNQRMTKLSGRDLIYGSTTGISSSSATTGSRYRSASMQRLNTRQQQQLMSAHRSQNEMYYEPENENPYAINSSGGLIGGGGGASSTLQPTMDDVQGHYGVTGGGLRRRPASKLGGPIGSATTRVASSMAAANYDIGRSSSGIYGNHSGSSSSDYADWHPQMRKVNSSGYLNSIFKHHHQGHLGHHHPSMSSSSQLALDPYDPGNPLNNNIKSNPTTAYNNNNNNLTGKTQSNRNHASRALKSVATAGSRPPSTLAAKQGLVHQVTSSVINGPAYRSYDSSNDSEPSYTNSSDGLDIYDQIGAHSRLNHHSHQHHHPHQFLASHPSHNLAPEIHVGEWENLYDR